MIPPSERRSAVALAYAANSTAPKVVAKGRGLIAEAQAQLGADVICDVVVSGGDRELLLAPTTIAVERLPVAEVWELPMAVPLGLYLASIPNAVLPEGSGWLR